MPMVYACTEKPVFSLMIEPLQSSTMYATIFSGASADTAKNAGKFLTTLFSLLKEYSL